MKTLTLTQPYASLIAFGAKRIETRTWATTYRGPLAIHAADGLDVAARATGTTVCAAGCGGAVPAAGFTKATLTCTR